MRPNLEDLLLEERLLDEAGLRQVRSHARRHGLSLARAAVEAGGLADTALAELLARRTGIQRVDINTESVDEDAVREVPHPLADSRRLLPLQIEDRQGRRTIRVAMADPLDLDAIEEIEMATGCQVEPVIATASDLARAIERHYRGIVTRMIPRGTAEPAPTNVEARLEALIDLLTERGLIDRAVLERILERRLKEPNRE